MDWSDSARLDEQLRMFENTKSKYIPREILFGDNSLEDWCSAIEFLVEKGYLKEHKDNFEITYAGKAFIHDGGFVGKDRRNRILSYCTIIAAISSVLAFVVSLIALICQLCG